MFSHNTFCTDNDRRQTATDGTR